MRLLRLATEPLLDLGAPGNFGQCRMGPSAALFVGARVFLYYVGFSLRRDVPHQQAIGLAISAGRRHQLPPRRAGAAVLSTGPFDPFFTSMPHVAQRGDAFEMHYMSGTAWPRHGDRFDPQYLIKRALSSDGIHWTTGAGIAVGFADAAETALARPWVIRRDDGQSHVAVPPRFTRQRGPFGGPLSARLRAVAGRSDLVPGGRRAAVREPAPIGRVGRRDASLSLRRAARRRAFSCSTTAMVSARPVRLRPGPDAH